MQPGSQPDDIHTILSRFHTWTEKNPGNGNAKKLSPEPGSVREIPYEEAMNNFRQRHKSQTRRVPAAAAPPAPDPLSALSEPVPPKPDEALPVPAAAAPQPDAAPVVAVPVAEAKPTALARRPPAALARTAPVLPSSDSKPARKKTDSRAKRATTQLMIPTVAPAQLTPVRVKPKTSVQTKPASRRAAPAKKSAAAAGRHQPAKSMNPAFKKVLAKTVARPVAQTLSTTSPAPDRNRRITTRFSTVEQRRLERAAAHAGLTVSAWLRQCALRAEAASAPPPALARPAKVAPAKAASSAKITRRALPAPPAESTLFSTPVPSGLGNWLTLLRQRFLSSPARFSERA
ncbi:MAG TPA: hypothetical protein VHX13_12160 [Acidobacteriaceae bacterium]|nr:hypothetical protein [Acidobacteriaceae bacterium]